MVPVPRSSRCPYTLLLIELPTPIFIVAQRSSRCPYSLLLIEVPLSEFFPFGNQAGDSELPPNDDSFSDVQIIGLDFTFSGFFHH
jgi:hypothetical protein